MITLAYISMKSTATPIEENELKIEKLNQIINEK